MRRYKNIIEIPVKEIKYRKVVRRISCTQMLAKKIRMDGFKHPFYVVKDGDGYLLREKVAMLEAAKYLGCKTVPCIVETEHQRRLRRNDFEIKYIQVGDNYLPIFPKMEQDEEFLLDHFGRERLEFLEKYRPEKYQKMINDNTLIDHLKDVQDRAEKMREANIKVFATYADVTEELKEKNPKEWLRKMNNISDNVDELIRCNIISE